jgi:DNA ligase-associated metallophosphoesterase
MKNKFHGLQCISPNLPAMTKHQWQGNTFWLNADRSMYWEDANTLVLSDVHLGKSGHFRKHGLAVPQEIMRQDMMRLFNAVQHTGARRLMVVGDLVHSHANRELDWFARWRSDHSYLEILLVKGNHDVLPNEWYRQLNIQTHPVWEEKGLQFIHDPAEAQVPEERPLVSGHLHPSIRIQQNLRQQLRVPCFYFSGQQCVLPAFGLFTGHSLIKPKKRAVVFAIAGHEVISIAL